MPAAGMATRTVPAESHRVLSLPLPTFAGPARGPRAARAAVVAAALAGLAGALAIADTARWLGMLLIVVGLVVSWAVGRRTAHGRREWAQLEAELQCQTRDLRESRARLANGADAERRRIERDLHDGCQQRLIALRIKLGLAEELVGAENEPALRLIQELAGDAESALHDLHTVVRGVYPSLLVDRGLPDALKGLARSAPMPVRVLAEGSARYPAEVEAAVYFACAEALQNAAKHAGVVASARIALRQDGSGLTFEVSDDGHGFGDDVTAGAGLANMEDRVGAVGGHLLVTSAPGRGTTVRGRVDEVQPLEPPLTARSAAGGAMDRHGC
jgi:signal transduction histidine kinase